MRTCGWHARRPLYAYMAMGPLSHQTQIYHIHTHSPSLSFCRHVHKSYPVESRFDNTDAYVVSGSEDGALHFYDLVEGKTLATYVCVCARRWK